MFNTANVHPHLIMHNTQMGILIFLSLSLSGVEHNNPQQ